MSDTYTSPTGGQRKNVGKLRYELLPPSWGAALAAVMGKGAEKYSDHNWEKGLPLLQLLACAERHIAAYKTGQDDDTETGLSHLAHAATNLLMALETHRRIYDTPLVPLPASLDNRPVEWDAETRPPETFLRPDPEPDANKASVEEEFEEFKAWSSMPQQPVCSHTCNNLAACKYFGRCITDDLCAEGDAS